MKLQFDSLMFPISESSKVTMCALKTLCIRIHLKRNDKHVTAPAFFEITPPPPARGDPSGAGAASTPRPPAGPRSGSGAGNRRQGEGLPRPPRATSGRPARLSPQFLVDTLAGLLFGRGYHRGSCRGLVLQDPLYGPVRSRRGRHCAPLRRSAQRRGLAWGPRRKGIAASRDSPGSRRARLGLKRPHLLSRSRRRFHDTTTPTPWRLADAAQLTVLARPRPPALYLRPSAGATPKPSGPALSRYLGWGGARTKPTFSLRPLLALSVGVPIPLTQGAQEMLKRTFREVLGLPLCRVVHLAKPPRPHHLMRSILLLIYLVGGKTEAQR